MKDLWRQFRRLLVKNVGYFDLFHEAAKTLGAHIFFTSHARVK
ncbi:MAG: hypothetical protein VXW42_01220 [Planctomycetota bacterium]|nr:hypothetical protein [Planctomycetota bacterium]